MLGLGDLTLSRKELTQSSGRRVDMVLADPETDAMYEVEIMLGPTDPCHIVRASEYWDPSLKGSTPAVASDITDHRWSIGELLTAGV